MATMQCIKMGCHLYSTEYGMYFRGDLYFKGRMGVDNLPIGDGQYVLKFNYNRFEPMESKIHCKVNAIDLHQVNVMGAYGATFGVLVFDSVEFFDYDGRPLQEAF